ncbi:MAG: MATE family efflux transporter, partial [Bacillales bacterium]|nr:MATE family efflux transporter [Bacillales bacterium]
MVKKYEMDMTSGNLFKKILVFALPLMFSSILQLLYNACDIIIIGRFRSHTALSAISSTGALINLIVNLFIGLSVGSNILMARCYGAKDEEKASKVAHTSVLVSFIMGIVLALFGFFFARDLLLLMGSPSDVIDLATIYVQIFFLGMPFNLLYNFGASLLRASGDTKRPLFFLLISGLFNVGANLIFVLLFNMSTDGVALATVLSQIISSILVLITLIKEKGYCHISF